MKKRMYAHACVLGMSAACSQGQPSPTACDVGEQLEGDLCVPSACGTFPWGDVPADASAIHVDTRAAPGGDGSAEAPLRTIQAALDAAASGDRSFIAIAAGTYDESVRITAVHDGVTLHGRCAQYVTVRGQDDDLPTIAVDGPRASRPRVHIEGMTITDGPQGGVHVTGGVVSLEDLVVTGNRYLSVGVENGSATLSRVTVTDTRPRSGEAFAVVAQQSSGLVLNDVLIQDAHAGLRLLDVADVTLERVSVTNASEGTCLSVFGETRLVGTDVDVSECVGSGIAADGEATVDLTGVRVAAVVPRDERDVDVYGDGISVSGGAHFHAKDIEVEGAVTALRSTGFGTVLQLSNAVLHDNSESGVFAQNGADASVSFADIAQNQWGVLGQGTNTRLTLESTDIHDNRSVGIDLWEVRSLHATDVRIVRNRDAGLHIARNLGTRRTDVVLDEVTIAETRGEGSHETSDAFGSGLYVAGAVDVDARALQIINNQSLGVMTGFGAQLVVDECAIASTIPAADQRYGRGIQIGDGAHVTLRRCTVEDNHEVGVLVAGAESLAELERTTIRGTRPSQVEDRATNGSGAGLYVADGAHTVARSVIVDGNAANGVTATGFGATVELYDSVVSATRPTPDGAFGRGVAAQRGARLTAVDSSVTDNAEIGAYVSGARTRFEARNLSLDGTRRGRQARFAIGLVATEGARVSIHDATLTNNEGPGAYAYGSGSIHLTDCDVNGNRFAGLIATGEGRLDVDSTTIRGNDSDPNVGGGIGIYTSSDGEVPHARLWQTTVEPHHYSAVWFDGDGIYELVSSTLYGGTGVPSRAGMQHGNAIVALNGVSRPPIPRNVLLAPQPGLSVRRTRIADAVGPAVFLDASSCRLRDNAWSGNTLDLLQQSCDEVSPLDTHDLAGTTVTSVCPPGTILYDTSVRAPRFEFTDVIIDY